MSADTEWAPRIKRVSGNERAQLAFSMTLVRDRRFDEAREELEKVLEANPSSFQGRLLLGIANLGVRQFKDALAHFKKATTLDPLNAQAVQLAGTAYLLLNNNEQAGEMFKAALEIDPKLPAAHVGIAQVMFRTGDVGQATAHAREALRLDPQLFPARILLARLYRKADRDDDAVAELKGLLQIDPGQPAAAILLSMIYNDQRKFRQAAAVLEPVAQMKPDANVWNALGRTRIELGDFAAAEQAYREAARLRPKDPAAPLRIVEALVPQGKLDQASEVLAKVPRRGRLGAMAHKYYGDIYAAQRLFEDAVRSYRAALLNSADGEKTVAELDRALPENGKIDWRLVLPNFQAAIEHKIEDARKRFAKQDWEDFAQRAPQGLDESFASGHVVA